jgi:hypothetical protein
LLPQPESLSRLAELKLEFVFSYAPAGREPKQITRKTRESAATYAEGDGVVRFAARALRITRAVLRPGAPETPAPGKVPEPVR